ncbi:class I SAM-dependent methyltransferase [Falsibacillus albus]|uniref:Class I SAM-dependent methyltransferase n=1 Tax=Falsibacillus albus TaxID=2478915 RepID=A0A3L7JWF4_9BACI|nr:class I SAM-dependent methyltransferase [Falsibacillus albus]RLQ94645.1 class I SAM-dependent methyltransferase [Falsibacillus albus]
MRNGHKVHLEKEQETLLITLQAKAHDSRLKKSILNDTKSAEILGQIDYDFDKFNSYDNGNIMVVRAKQLDAWVEDFLKQHGEAVVLNLGCGLDTRFSRINPGPNVSWYDVDYPEVINFRKLFYSGEAGYEMIESSVTADGWIEQMPNDKPTLVIAEGILEYLTEEEVQTLFNRITNHFSHGQIAFDVMNSFAINAGKENLKQQTGAEHKWAVDDTSHVDQLDRKFKRLADISVFQSKYMKKLSPKYRLMYGVMRMIPNFRDMIRLLRYRF